MKASLFFILALFLLAPSRASAELSVDEFRALARELAPKVNLFADAWAQDPEAEFYGGTTRDFLYWVKGQLAEGKTPEQLRKLEHIDVRDFIIGDSDVDIVSKKYLSLSPGNYGVRKIDSIKPDRFDATTTAGKDELRQGYIPVEKIRLGGKGFIPWSGVGDGIGEIHSGRVTVHFATDEEFQGTEFAKKKLNHPVLLALRFLRLAAINYYRSHGKGYPNREALFDLDKASAEAVRAVIRKAADSEELKPYLAETKFSEWLNASVKKAFLSYTNPNAAKALFDEFGVPDLLLRYPKGIEPYNVFLFERYPQPDLVKAHLAAFGTTEQALFTPIKQVFPDLQFFHGTRTDGSFRAILFQGILPSEGGSAGRGLYGVARRNISFSEKWAGDPKRVVSFTLGEGTRLIDITQGEGQRLFKAFGGTEDAFADYFGADILRYPYGSEEAFVVKNSGVLSGPQGDRVQLLSFSKLHERAAEIHDREAFGGFLELLKLNQVSTRELKLLLKTVAGKSKDANIRVPLAEVLGIWDGGPAPKDFAPWMGELLPRLLGRSNELDAAIAGTLLARLDLKQLRNLKPVLELMETRPHLLSAYISSRIEPSVLVEHWNDLKPMLNVVIGTMAFPREWSETDAALIRLATSDPDPELRAMAIGRLNFTEEPSKLQHEIMERAAADPDPRVRRAALRAERDNTSGLPDHAAKNMGFIGIVLKLISDPTEAIRLSAMDAFYERYKSGHLPVMGVHELLPIFNEFFKDKVTRTTRRAGEFFTGGSHDALLPPPVLARFLTEPELQPFLEKIAAADEKWHFKYRSFADAIMKANITTPVALKIVARLRGGSQEALQFYRRNKIYDADTLREVAAKLIDAQGYVNADTFYFLLESKPKDPAVRAALAGTLEKNFDPERGMRLFHFFRESPGTDAEVMTALVAGFKAYAGKYVEIMNGNQRASHDIELWSWSIRDGLGALAANGLTEAAPLREVLEDPSVLRWVKSSQPQLMKGLRDRAAEAEAARKTAEAARIADTGKKLADARDEEAAARRKHREYRRRIAQSRADELEMRYPSVAHLAELARMDRELDEMERTDRKYFDCLHSYLALSASIPGPPR